MVTVPTYGCREETLRAEGNFIIHLVYLPTVDG